MDDDERFPKDGVRIEAAPGVLGCCVEDGEEAGYDEFQSCAYESEEQVSFGHRSPSFLCSILWVFVVSGLPIHPERRKRDGAFAPSLFPCQAYVHVSKSFVRPDSKPK